MIQPYKKIYKIIYLKSQYFKDFAPICVCNEKIKFYSELLEEKFCFEQKEEGNTLTILEIEDDILLDGNTNHSLNLWSLKDKKLIESIKLDSGIIFCNNSMLYDKENKIVLLGCWDSYFKVISLEKHMIIKNICVLNFGNYWEVEEINLEEIFGIPSFLKLRNGKFLVNLFREDTEYDRLKFNLIIYDKEFKDNIKFN